MRRPRSPSADQPGEVLILSTAKPVAAILEQGGSRSWILNPLRMRNVDYVVCAWRATRTISSYDPLPGQAFLVGRVARLRPDCNDGARSRYYVQFSEYALTEVDDFWPHRRIGPRYASLAKVAEKGLDIAGLTFVPMPPTSKDIGSTVSGRALVSYITD